MNPITFPRLPDFVVRSLEPISHNGFIAGAAWATQQLVRRAA